ncbi:copper resistance CopC family protein [Microbacterium sp. DT81.1]|uniref:copper resistance CopC family protein n=1 Tax=Microbacterium sp. DT81.1 TaxID=3393413 RepID=UPI003CE734D6
MARPIRGMLGTAAALTFAVAVVTGMATPAAAHDDLVSSTPTGGETVTEAPASVSLTFSGDLLDGGASAVLIEVTDGAGTVVNEGDAAIEGATVTQPVRTGLPAGDYTVTWRVVSSDGHPIASDFHFFIAEAAAPAVAPTPSPSETTTPTPSNTPSASSASESPSGYGGQPSGGGEVFPIALLTGIVVVLGVAVVAVLGLRQKRRDQDARDAAREKRAADDA